jgi:hypothetical protein
MKLRRTIIIAGASIAIVGLFSLVLVWLRQEGADMYESLLQIFLMMVASGVIITGFVAWKRWRLGRARTILEKWAAKNYYEVLHCDRPFSTGGFSFWTTANDQVVLLATLQERGGPVRKAWVRCGSVLGGLSSDDIEVKWIYETKPTNEPELPSR